MPAAACGHVPCDLGALDADLVSVSAHKLGGVPGAGALVVRRGTRIEPLLVGGEQERGRRAGLEPVPALMAFGAAAEALTTEGGRACEDEAATARGQITALVEAARDIEGVDGGRALGRPPAGSPTWSAWACRASRPSPW